LLAKPPPRNVNLGSDRFAMFNKERDIPLRNARHEQMFSGLPPIADVSRTYRHFRVVPIVLQKSFCTGDENFCGP
jgi:hypothetical protein